MLLLSRAKRRVGVGLGSAAMEADARQTDFCTYLLGILLGGLLLNALFGLWWADPVAGLVMVPIIAKEEFQSGRVRHAAAVVPDRHWAGPHWIVSGFMAVFGVSPEFGTL
jgi:hypothetical protein